MEWLESLGNELTQGNPRTERHLGDVPRREDLNSLWQVFPAYVGQRRNEVDLAHDGREEVELRRCGLKSDKNHPATAADAGKGCRGRGWCS